MTLPHHDLPEGGIGSPSEACGPIKTPLTPTNPLYSKTNQRKPKSGSQKTVLDLFDAILAETPQAEALRFDNFFLTYSALDAASNRLAHYLRSQGLKEESLVPICMDRSFELIIGLLGVIKAGASYVPVDPHTPNHQVQRIIKEIDAEFALIHAATRDKMTSNDEVVFISWEDIESTLISQPESRPVIDLKADHLAYIVFTSGSTGNPKGVLIEHAQLFNATQARCLYYKNFFNTLLIPPLSFDASLAAIFGSLCSGGCLIICSQEDLQDPQRLAQLIPQIDTLLCVPSYYQFLLDGGLLEYSKVSKVILGGEAISPALVSSHFEKNKQAQLYNEYGPTETTIWATVERIESPESIISIGLPIEGADIHILDHDGKPVGENTIGELFIGGKGLARGYLNDPENTATHFVENPLVAPGSRLYRTGDLGYRLQDGRIVFVGRTDDQVKINGYRIEPGQIEAALHQIPGVHKATVIAKEAQQGGKYLVAFVQQDNKWDKSWLKAQLQQHLPDYMIPNLWVQMDSFPMSSNGKVDRRALQLHQFTDAPPISELDAADPIEDYLLSLYRQYLPTPITVDDDFFEAGGNSLMAMNMVAAIRRALKIDLSVSTFFKMPTVAKLAACIKPLTAYISQKAEDVPSEDAEGESLPLSYGQENFWLIDQMGESLAYHLPFAFRIQGELDVLALNAAIRTILQRHEPLRTTIQGEGENMHGLLLPSEDWTLTQLEDAFEPDKLAELIQQPFNLHEDYMLRAWLIQHTPEDHSLLFVIHHIAFDAWSKTVFLEELWAAYHAFMSGLPLTLPPLSITYTHYARSQKSNAHRALDKLEYWKGKLQDFSPLQLPRDHFLASSHTEGAIKRFSISPRLLGEIKALSRRQGATDFMTLLAGFKVLLHRYSSQEDILVGTAIAGREQAGTEALIGYFVNSLPLRTTIKGTAAFLDVLNEVKQTTLEAYDAKEVPFEKIVAEIGLERLSGQNPLFQVMFNFHNVPQAAIDGNNQLTVSTLDLPQASSKFDLTFSLSEDAGQIQGEVEYRKASYRSSTIDRMIQHYLLLLEMAVHQPEESIGTLNMIGEKEQLLLRTFNQTSREYPQGETILDLLERQVGKTPDKTAVIFGEQHISYKELNEKSNQLAHLLREKGAREETLVLLCMNRSLEMVIAMLGILKSGAAYVPVDPAYPQERKEFIQQDTAAPLTVTDPENQKHLSAIPGIDLIILEKAAANLRNHSTQKVETAIQPAQLAYIIYTSGSTGKPKGVMIEHGNVYDFISWCKEEFSSSPVDIIYAATSVCFDLSIFEIFYSLTTGTSMRLLQSALEIKQHLPEDRRVMINTVPSVVGHLLEERTDLSNVSVLNMAGEPVTKTILDNLDVDRIQVRNLYGPTEDTTYSTSYRITATREIWIGKPISNTCVHIVNQEGSLNPVGVPGEICLSGSGLARGYFNRPDLTDGKFVLNPFTPEQGARMYKTGDMGRWLPDGHIEYIGRKDDQVKIRGFRIELGEIERALQEYEKVRQAAVLAKADHKSNQQLVGYLVVDGPWDKTAIVSFLKQRLPAYMVPSLWLQLEAFPLTPNGKIDKKKLPDPLEERQAETVFVGPRNETETKLAQIWRDLLGKEPVGIYEDFFTSGGHSLMATRFIAAVRKEYPVDIRLQDFFANPTLAGLAEHLDLESLPSNLPAIQPRHPRPDRVPLSYNQESLWFIDQLSGSKHYHIPVVLKLTGSLDRQVLEQSLRLIIERHEVLRTVIRHDEGLPYQVVSNSAGWELEIKEQDKDEKTDPINLLIDDIIDQPFDLSKDYMLRASLIPVSETDHVLVLVFHHIAFDGWSTSLFLNELTFFYSAQRKRRKKSLPVLPLQYSDYAIWQKHYLPDDILEKQSRYWRDKLQGVSTLQLPLDYPRPQIQNYTGAVEIIAIDQDLKENLLTLGQKCSATLYMVLLSAFKVLLFRVSSQQDLCVGTVTAGRHDTYTEQLIGDFINTLPIRTQIKPQDTFLDLVEKVKIASLEAFENQELPLKRIIAEAGVKRDLARNPLFPVLFVMQNFPEESSFNLEGLTARKLPVKQSFSKFDLSFILTAPPSGLTLTLEYNSDLFKIETIKQLVSDYHKMLSLIVSNPAIKIDEINVQDKVTQPQVGLYMQENAHTVTPLDQNSFATDEQIEEKEIRKLEQRLAKIWSKAFGIKSIDINDNFFEIGGQSSTAEQIMIQCEKELGTRLPLAIFLKYPTIKGTARALKQRDIKSMLLEPIVALQAAGTKPPWYVILQGSTDLLFAFSIVKNMEFDQPVYILQPKGLDENDKPIESVEAIASNCVRSILNHDPRSPISLAGNSFGGITAYETARQLKGMGKEINHLVIVDSFAFKRSLIEKWHARIHKWSQQIRGKRWPSLFLSTKHSETERSSSNRRLPLARSMKELKDIEGNHEKAVQNYLLKPFDGIIHLIKTGRSSHYTKDPYWGWGAYVKQVNVKDLARRDNLLPTQELFARALKEILNP